MSSERSSRSSRGGGGGIGCSTILFFIFLTLKLTGHITWSWWWVTAPLWIPFGIVLGIVGIILVAAIVLTICGKLFK